MRKKEMYLEEEKMMTPEEVGGYLHLGMSTVYSLLRRGQIPSIKIQHQYRVPMSQLNNWIMDNLYSEIAVEGRG